MITILITNASLRRPILTALALAVLATTIVGCAGEPGDGASQPRIVATTSIWGDVVGHIVGDEAEVQVLMPIGADVHDFQLTAQQTASLQEADLVIANGLGLEEGLADVLDSAAEDGANVFEVAPELDPLPFVGHEVGDATEEHGGLDPHVWFDPARVATAAELIAARLAEVDDSVDWRSRATGYAEDLSAADEEISRALESVDDAKRKLVTNHDSLGYFADRYGFEVIAVVIPGGSTMGDPSSAEMAALVAEIEREDVRTIFAETTQPTRLADAVAAEVGAAVSVVQIYTGSLGEPGSGADTLIGMLTTDAALISGALSG